MSEDFPDINNQQPPDDKTKYSQPGINEQGIGNAGISSNVNDFTDKEYSKSAEEAAPDFSIKVDNQNPDKDLTKNPDDYKDPNSPNGGGGVPPLHTAANAMPLPFEMDPKSSPIQEAPKQTFIEIDKDQQN